MNIVKKLSAKFLPFRVNKRVPIDEVSWEVRDGENIAIVGTQEQVNELRQADELNDMGYFIVFEYLRRLSDFEFGSPIQSNKTGGSVYSANHETDTMH